MSLVESKSWNVNNIMCIFKNYINIFPLVKISSMGKSRVSSM